MKTKVLPFRKETRSVLVNTSVWVDYLRNRDTKQTECLEANLQSPLLGMLDLTFCELLQGQRSLRDLETLRENLTAFRIFATGGIELALTSARNYLALRQRGITIRTTIDCLIATYALEGKRTLPHTTGTSIRFVQHLGLQVLHPVSN